LNRFCQPVGSGRVTDHIGLNRHKEPPQREIAEAFPTLVAARTLNHPHSGGSSNNVGSSCCGIEILLLLAGVKPNSDAIRIMISA
jgi:hypothetical protein